MYGIKEKGYILHEVRPPDYFQELIFKEDWNLLDLECSKLTQKDSLIFNLLSQFYPIQDIEFIISLRVAGDNEDGIWHDDGSRKIAFSWSLTPESFSPEGGILSLRPKKEPSHIQNIKTPHYGEMIIFRTGEDGWEHKISEVTGGKRLVIAGWGQ